MFEDILTKMKNKIENEYDILIDIIPDEIDKIWTGQPTVPSLINSWSSIDYETLTTITRLGCPPNNGSLLDGE